MTTRSWDGGTGDWYNALLWSTTTDETGAPVPGDTVLINSGTVTVSGAEETTIGVGLDAVLVTLGAVTMLDPAVIAATDARLGQAFTIVSNATAPYATFDTTGPTGLSGTILASAAGGTFGIDATAADGTQQGAFVLLHGGLIDVSGGDDLILTGSMVTDSNVTIAAGSTFTNNGIDSVFGGTTFISPTATLTGAGTFEAGPGATLEFESAVPATQIITFGTAGRLDLTSPSTFAGTIASFVLSDTIDLLNIVANSASYDLGSGLLTIDDNGSPVATIAMQGPTSSMLLNTSSDGSGGTLITYPGSASRTSYEIDVADQAVQADVVRQTLTTAAGAPINGAGITIGIMSDSFNATLNGVVDPADVAAALGYLPETADDTSAVTILKDSTQSGVVNEGLAMAELVHQIAPGAAIDFYTAEGGQESFAQGVTALVQAGANIIVDDWSFSDTPFYQVAGPVETAVENAVSAGVDYFTAASNFGDAYYESTWQPTAAQLVLQSGQPAQDVTAQQFSDGTPLQTITIPGSLATTIELQWNAAWPTPGGSVSDPIAMALYTANGTLVNTSSQVFDSSADYGFIPEIQLSIPVTSVATQYELAIYQTGTASVSQFKYVLFGTPGTVAVDATVGDGSTVSAQDPGGIIDDPAAGQGSGDVHGQELVPGANTAGASYWSTSPAFGVAPDWTEYFSSVGPGTLLYDQNGNPLTTPQSAGKVDFVAPDGIQTSVPGFQAFFGTSAAAPDAAAVAALMLQADPSLTTSQVTSILEQTALNMNLPAADQGAGLIQADAAVAFAQTLCFLRGTRIGTPAGEVPVECLTAGDTVLTLCGGTRRIVWIGKGHVLATRGRRGPATPVIVRQGAFAPDVPHRDLHVTKGHAFYIDGVLIPVEFLVNHRSIIWDDHAQEVTLYHVELDTHDALLANGALAESYRDDGNRWLFQNANSGWGLPPQQPFAPVLTGGPIVDAAWRRLLDRTGPRPGLSMTHDPDLHLLVDGCRIDVTQRAADAHVFTLPDRPGTVRIVSRAAVPQEVGVARDARDLGVALRGIALRRGTRFQLIKATDPRLVDGFHDFEPDTGVRWTDGDATLPAALFDGWYGPMEVVLTVGGTTRYIDDGDCRLVA
ncbi:Hint domain-containing protein [Acidisphaera sp. S103]|uniref:Hint domain-containing protein n=1 Tax=Acidisphaera sp. S103 TaxID=1747223 RepID=UPI00131B0148|nr:Hint domain-containing protein [Acidisphaera sp. S103]